MGKAPGNQVSRVSVYSRPNEDPELLDATSAAEKSMRAARATREGHQSSAEPLPLSQSLMYACGLGIGDLEPL